MSVLVIRRLHKWIGIIIGLQLLLWTLSGAMMSLIDHEQVSGGHGAEPPPAPAMPASAAAWPIALRSLGGAPVTGIAVRPMLDRQVIEIATPGGVRLFDAASGATIPVDALLARRVAEAAYAGEGKVKRVIALGELSLAVREHELPIWQVDFADEANSSFYVSASTGKLLERRNDSWRLWDFFWMLHNMDYAERTSFNHPVIVTVGFFAVWLALSGFLLIFQASWKREALWLRKRQPRP